MSERSHQKQLVNIGIALIAIWLAIVLYSYLYQFSGLLTIYDFVFRPWAQIRGATLYYWTPWLLLAPIVQYLATRFQIRPDSSIKILFQHLVFMTLLAIMHGYLAAMLYYHIGNLEPGMEMYAAWQHTGHFLFMDDVYLMDCFIYSVLLASISLRHFYELARKSELDVARAQTQLVESRLHALKMQINPHFLFNTLNSIAVLIRKHDNADAEHMLNSLSDFFRLTLEHGQEQLVTVKQEIELIRQYLEIEKIRFGERLTVDYQIDHACYQEKVPVLLLQPLVENAIKHGLGKKRGHCLLQISINKTIKGMSLQVTDDGAGISENDSKSTGVGLGNIQSRLMALYANRARFSFTSVPGEGACASILIPMKTRLGSPV